MVVLGGEDIKEYIEKEKMIEGYKDMNTQLTPNGFDVRVGCIIEVLKAGEVGLTKQQNKQPVFGNAYILEGHSDLVKDIEVKESITLQEGEIVNLKALKPYLVITCEKVNVPPDLFFKIEIRSTLFRYGQMILETSFGEAGYRGFLTFLLLPTLDTGLAIGSRIAQLSFGKLSCSGRYENQKEFSYQGGKIL